MKHLNVRVADTVAQVLEGQAQQAGVPLAEAVRVAIDRGLSTRTESDPTAELRQLLFACLRAATAAAAISELAAERGLSQVDREELRATGQQRIDSKFKGLLEMFSINMEDENER